MQIWETSLTPVSAVNHNFTPSGGPHVSHTFSLISDIFWILVPEKEPEVPPLLFRK